MDLFQSPRIVKIKSMPNQKAFTYLDKFTPIHTPKISGQAPRATSLAETRKISKNMNYSIQNTSKQIRKIYTPANTKFPNQKEYFEKKINELEVEKNIYKYEYLKLFEFVTKRMKMDMKTKEEFRDILKSNKNIEGIGEIQSFLAKKDNEDVNSDSPFELDSNKISNIATARFQSFNELQMNELLNSCSEVIALENFNNCDDDNLKFNAGDRIKIIRKINDKWWLGCHNSVIGKFPAHLVLID